MEEAGRLALAAGASALKLVDVLGFVAKADAADFSVDDINSYVFSAEPLALDQPVPSVKIEGGMLTRDRKGLSNAITLLGLDVRYNTRAHSDEIRRASTDDSLRHVPTAWTRITDLIADSVVDLIAERFTFATGRHARFGAETWRVSLNAILSRKQIDPMKEWLYSLPKWDSQPRLDTLLVDCLGAPDTILNREAAGFLVAAVSRTFEPGAQHDWIPIIVGSQGIGKSTFCRNLLPATHRREWFVSNVDLAATDQQRTERTMAAVIVEFSELSGIMKSDLEHVKSFVTEMWSTVRLSYRRNPEQVERQWVGIGTANDDQTGVLPLDRTGYRRFIIVRTGVGCSARGVREYLDEHRDQLWAEAMARSLKGETTELSEQAEAMQTAMNPQLARADEPIDNAVGNLTKKYAGKEPQTLVDMMVAMQLASDAAAAGKDKSSQKLLGSALTEAGWVKKREMVNGVRTIRWHAPFCAECARYEGGAISNLRCPPAHRGSHPMKPLEDMGKFATVVVESTVADQYDGMELTQREAWR